VSDLAAALAELLPLAVTWAEAQAANALATGQTLSDLGRQLAISVGVQRTDLVRVKLVDQLPQPTHPDLLAVGLQTGLLGPQMAGITLGYAIIIRQRQLSNRLISHELRHVHQYEAFGSIGNFLTTYLAQIASVGYHQSPLEIDARQHECDWP